MQENLRTFADFKPMDNDELKTVEQARALINAVPTIQCTTCEYCMKGCPKNIAITASGI